MVTPGGRGDAIGFAESPRESLVAAEPPASRDLADRHVGESPVTQLMKAVAQSLLADMSCERDAGVRENGEQMAAGNLKLAADMLGRQTGIMEFIGDEAEDSCQQITLAASRLVDRNPGRDRAQQQCTELIGREVIHQIEIVRDILKGAKIGRREPSGPVSGDDGGRLRRHLPQLPPQSIAGQRCANQVATLRETNRKGLVGVDEDNVARPCDSGLTMLLDNGFARDLQIGEEGAILEAADAGGRSPDR